MASNQVIVSTGLSGSNFNVMVTDVVTGATLSTLKSDWIARPGTVCQLSSHWAAAELQSPVIHFWTKQKGRGSQEVKVICPGRVTAMTICADFCIAGISEKLYVWQISTGLLVAVVDCCYQPITVVKHCPTGELVAVGSEDGSVTIWSLSVLCQEPCRRSQTTSPEAFASFSCHSAAVTDLSFVSHNECVSVSMDGKCCMYDLSRKVVTFQISSGSAAHAVAMDRAKYRLFVGCESGEIKETRLFSRNESCITSGASGGEEDTASSFIGHSQKVTCLDVTIDGMGLVSGSADGTIRLWNIQSRQCTRCSTPNDPIGSLQIMTLPGLSNASENCLIASRFERIPSRSQINQSSFSSALQPINGQSHAILKSGGVEDRRRRPKSSSDPSLMMELEKQKKINRDLYNLCIRKEFIAAFSSK